VTNDGREIPVRLNLIDDPQGAAAQVNTLNSIDDALTRLGENEGFLLQAENAERMRESAEEAVNAGGGGGGGGSGGGKFGRASRFAGQAAVGVGLSEGLSFSL